MKDVTLTAWCVANPHGAAIEIERLRAQVERLNEPTRAMLDAARDWSIAKYGRGIGDDAAIGCWQVMNDAKDH